MSKHSFILALVFLLLGFAAAYLIFGGDANTRLNKHQSDNVAAKDRSADTPENEYKIINPFSAKDSRQPVSERLDFLENEVVLIRQQLQQIKTTLKDLNAAAVPAADKQQATLANSKRPSSALTKRLYNLDNLIRGGIDAAIAEDIVRRKNAIELKRLALHDRASRDNYLNSPRYFNELETINLHDLSLREELGEQQYDQYLFNSKQNNRVRIASVMLGSPAEQAGIQKGDVVLSYNNNRMYNWHELKDATAEGQLGEYVSISISRNGEIFSFSVPRGPLGVQLGATRLQP